MANDISYIRRGDYYCPNIASKKQIETIGLWGRRRHEYLREHSRIEYELLIMTGCLLEHLREVDRRASAMADRLIRQMSMSEQIDDALKERDPMTWLQGMNRIRNEVWEFVTGSALREVKWKIETGHCDIINVTVQMERLSRQ